VIDDVSSLTPNAMHPDPQYPLTPVDMPRRLFHSGQTIETLR
jgi:hypothetical protein